MTVATVDIGGVCVEAPTSNPPQPPKAMASPHADTMLYGTLSPAHPKPENASLFPWDNLHTDFMSMATRYAAEMQEARKIADQWWYACNAARKERDALKAQVAELERALAQLRGDGFAVS